MAASLVGLKRERHNVKSWALHIRQLKWKAKELAFKHARSATLATFIIFTGATSGSAAPDILKGKTIAVSWTEVRNEKVDSLDSAMTTVTVNFSLKTYISEKGRPFTRMTRSGGPGSGIGRKSAGGRNHVSDQGPVDQNSLGSAGAVGFSGRTMTVTRTFSSGARQVSAIFDSGFSNCRARIVVGKQGGAGYLAGTSMMGRKEFIYSSAVSGESCSISAGNEFSQ